MIVCASDHKFSNPFNSARWSDIIMPLIIDTPWTIFLTITATTEFLER